MFSENFLRDFFRMPREEPEPAGRLAFAIRSITGVTVSKAASDNTPGVSPSEVIAWLKELQQLRTSSPASGERGLLTE